MDPEVIETKKPSPSPLPSLRKRPYHPSDDLKTDYNPNAFDLYLDFMDPERESQW